MNDKIELQFTYEAEDYSRARKYIQSRIFLLKHIYLFPFAVIFITLLFNFIKNPAQFIAAFSQPQGFLPIVVAVVIMIPVFYFFSRNNSNFLGGFLIKKQLENTIKSSPALSQPQFLSFDETGLFTRSSLAENLVRWDAFIEATETKDDFYFFTAKRIARFVPKKEFINQYQQNQLRELAKRKLGDKAKL